MAADDDIARSLPQPTPPRPARRDSAIEAAMRRFDGDAGAPGLPSRQRPAGASGAWWTRIGRPQAGALVAAGLVAILALPFAWTSFEPRGGGAAGPAAPASTASSAENYAAIDLDEAESAASAPASRRAARGEPAPPAALAADSSAAPPLEAPARAAARGAEEPAPAALPPATAVAAAAREADSPVIVTGARIRAPAAAAAAATIATRMGASAPAPRSRGDWNACTVDDPERSLAACRGLVDPGAKGEAGRAAAHVADGLGRAWSGDYDGAIAGFDRAIMAAPRSAAAYLNRGLVHHRKGETDAALADLDRAVRFAPRSARAYYNRSLVLRQRGDLPRARADEARAVALDPRYAALRRAGE